MRRQFHFGGRSGEFATHKVDVRGEAPERLSHRRPSLPPRFIEPFRPDGRHYHSIDTFGGIVDGTGAQPTGASDAAGRQTPAGKPGEEPR